MRLRPRRRKDDNGQQPIIQVYGTVPAPEMAAQAPQVQTRKVQQTPQDSGKQPHPVEHRVTVVEDEDFDTFMERGGSQPVRMSPDAHKDLIGITLTSPEDDQLMERSIIERSMFEPLVMMMTMEHALISKRPLDPVTGKPKSLVQLYIENRLRTSRSVEGRWLKTALDIGRVQKEQQDMGNIFGA